jgi:hypothetical protein
MSPQNLETHPVQSAPSLLRFSSEKQLQDYCLAVLRSKGIPAQAEVWCGNVRADIVTDRAVMELKKVLDRNAIYQAYGQAMVYQKFFNKAEVWLVGQTPNDPTERATAFTVAKEISAHNVKVSFIESDSFWRMRTIALPVSFNVFNCSNLSRQSAGILLVILSAFIFSAFDFFRGQFVDSEVGHSSLDATVPVSTTPPIQEVPNRLNAPPSAAPLVQIKGCNGGSIANFRRSPTLDGAVVFGVLQVGDAVQPTGRIAQADGVTWIEATAPVQYPNQVGWVAACFVR